jgi:serine/threonine protein kinase
VEVDAARLETLVGKPRFVAERSWTGVEVDGILVEDVIGAGGMGTVYRAHSLRDGQRLAVKFLSPSLAADPELLGRFSREVALLAKLDHPAIVKVRAHGQTQGVPWFAMDLVDGPTLAARLDQGPLGLAEAQATFSGLLDALAHAHAQGVVHRDLKPANVLLAPEGARLADFGIAHLDLQAGSRTTQLTRTAAILGTFSYMSPEQRAGRRVDARSDLYSVGVMLYEALAGRRPEGAFSSLHRLRPEVPGALDQLVLRLLQPDPAVRVPTALQARRELAHAFSRSLRRPMLWTTTGVAASALAVALFFAGRNSPTAKQSTGLPASVSRSASPTPPAPASPDQVPREGPETQAPPSVVPEPSRLLDGKLARDKTPMPSGAKARGKVADPLIARKRQGKVSFGAKEPFLDLKNAQPDPVQQDPAPATQQMIPLLKSSSKAQAVDERATPAKTTLKRPSKGLRTKDFPDKALDLR